MIGPVSSEVSGARICGRVLRLRLEDSRGNQGMRRQRQELVVLQICVSHPVVEEASAVQSPQVRCNPDLPVSVSA